MRKEKKQKDFIKCPRCGTKNMVIQKRCSECNLVFSRLKYVSNKLAKKKLIRGDREFVIYVNETPSDMKRLNLILYCALLGLFGAHNFYAGRFVKAFFMLIFGLVATFLVAFESILPSYDKIIAYVGIFIGITGIMWLYDLILIIIKKYKIPVTLESEE